MILVTLLLPIFFYFKTALRFLWTADSGDLLTASFVGTLAHPPGYPLYTLFVKLFSLLPFQSFAFKASLLSAFTSVVALYFLYKTFLIIVQLHESNSLLKKVLANISVLICAFVPLWWLYSITQEVFMMTACFIVVINYFAVKSLHKVPSTRSLFMYISLLSFAVFHQYIIVLILAPLFLVFVRIRKMLTPKVVAVSSVFALSGFIPYLFFLKTSSANILWYKTDSIVDLLFVALRKNYGTASVFGKSILLSSLSERFATVLYYFEQILQSYSVLFAFVLLGLVFFIKNKKTRSVGLFFLLEFFMFGPVLFMLYPIDVSVTFSRVIIERFILLSFPPLFVFLFWGLYSAFVLFKRFQKTYRAQFLYVTLLTFIPILLLVKNYSYFRVIAYDKTIQSIGERVLQFVPKNTLLIANNDIIFFPIEYTSRVLGVRPDVVVVSQSTVSSLSMRFARIDWFKKNKVLLPKDNNKKYFDSFVELNNKVRPVYSVFSIDGSDIFTQIGPAYVHGKNPGINYDKARSFFDNLSMQDYQQGSRIKPYGIMEAERFFAKAANFYAKHWFAKGDYLKAIQFAHISSEMYLSKETMYFLGGIYYKIGDCNSAREIWKKSYFQFVDENAVRQLKNLELVCFKNKSRAAFWLYIEKHMKQK